MSTSSKKQSKSKLSAAAMQSAAPELYCDESFGDIEEDLLRAATEQAEASQAAAKKQKVVAAAADDAEPVEAPPQEGEADIQEPERMIVPASSAPYARPHDSTTAVIEFNDDDDIYNAEAGGEVAAPDFMTKFYNFGKQMMPLYNKGVKTTNPDLALFVWDQAGRHNLHILGFKDLPKAVIVSKTQQKRINDKGEKVPTGKSFVNVTTKAPQRFLQGRLPGFKFHAMTPFGTNAFMKWGPTKETGVEGHRGKVIKGNVVKDEAAQYQFQLTNKSFSHMQQDGDYNNPVMTKFIEELSALDSVILDKVIGNDEMVPEIRLQYKKAGTAMTLKDYVKMAKLYKVIEDEDENDPTAKSRGFAVSVFRTLRKDFVTGLLLEEPTPPPSDLFHVVQMDQQGNPMAHNRIPMYRCRRADEVQPGVRYDSPFVLVPWDNAALGPNDVFATVFSLNFYEWQYDKCGRTNKPIAFIWLNTKQALEAMDRSAIEPCDPRYAIPMAGHYRGPKGGRALRAPAQAAAAAVEGVASGNGVSFMSSASA
jgi:hypothetical protein